MWNITLFLKASNTTGSYFKDIVHRFISTFQPCLVPVTVYRLAYAMPTTIGHSNKTVMKTRRRRRKKSRHKAINGKIGAAWNQINNTLNILFEFDFLVSLSIISSVVLAHGRNSYAPFFPLFCTWLWHWNDSLFLSIPFSTLPSFILYCSMVFHLSEWRFHFFLFVSSFYFCCCVSVLAHLFFSLSLILFITPVDMSHCVWQHGIFLTIYFPSAAVAATAPSKFNESKECQS